MKVDARECNGCGKCQPFCPLFTTSALEERSPRGFVRLAAAALAEGPPLAIEVRETLKACLRCRLCSGRCPVGVDPYEAVRDALARLGGACGARRPKVRAPRLDAPAGRPGRADGSYPTALFVGCAAADDEALVRFARELAPEAALVRGGCCGAGAAAPGGKSLAEAQLSALAAALRRVETLLVTCAHCYHELLSAKEAGLRLPRPVWLWSEAARRAEEAPRKPERRVRYFAGCAERLRGLDADVLRFLKATGHEVETAGGCCGNAPGRRGPAVETPKGGVLVSCSRCAAALPAARPIWRVLRATGASDRRSRRPRKTATRRASRILDSHSAEKTSKERRSPVYTNVRRRMRRGASSGSRGGDRGVV